jgi:hypothetical protein
MQESLSLLRSWLERLTACQAEGCRAAETEMPEIFKIVPQKIQGCHPRLHEHSTSQGNSLMKYGMKTRGILTLVVLVSLMVVQPVLLLHPPRQGKPNVILIMTDDMDFSLMPHMKYTNELIVQEGAAFTNYFVTSPLCCPSRTSLIRGQYPHNTNILENAPGFRNFFRNGREEETIATWLNKAGYRTSLAGKYMNGYPVTAGDNYVPPGWTDWHVFFHHGPENDEGGYYFNYTMNENGRLVEYGIEPEEYSTDVLRQRSVEFIEQSMQDRSPFFLMVTTTAPHGPSIPAPRHEGLLADLEYPQKPSFLDGGCQRKTCGRPGSCHGPRRGIRRVRRQCILQEARRNPSGGG